MNPGVYVRRERIGMGMSTSMFFSLFAYSDIDAYSCMDETSESPGIVLNDLENASP